MGLQKTHGSQGQAFFLAKNDDGDGAAVAEHAHQLLISREAGSQNPLTLTVLSRRSDHYEGGGVTSYNQRNGKNDVIQIPTNRYRLD